MQNMRCKLVWGYTKNRMRSAVAALVVIAPVSIVILMTFCTTVSVCTKPDTCTRRKVTIVPEMTRSQSADPPSQTVVTATTVWLVLVRDPRA